MRNGPRHKWQLLSAEWRQDTCKVCGLLRIRGIRRNEYMSNGIRVKYRPCRN